MDQLDRWLDAIDAAHAADPEQDAGRPAELVYAERMSSALARLDPDAPAALRLAARAQHLERWTRPRAAYPQGRAGYLAWRRDAGRAHAEAVARILQEAGAPAALGARVAELITKKGSRSDAEAQRLEDAACLVFVEFYFEAFAAKHDEAKVLDIVRKTWRKMSEQGQREALSLRLSAPARALMTRALEG